MLQLMLLEDTDAAEAESVASGSVVVIASEALKNAFAFILLHLSP